MSQPLAKDRRAQMRRPLDRGLAAKALGRMQGATIVRADSTRIVVDLGGIRAQFPAGHIQRLARNFAPGDRVQVWIAGINGAVDDLRVRESGIRPALQVLPFRPSQRRLKKATRALLQLYGHMREKGEAEHSMLPVHDAETGLRAYRLLLPEGRRPSNVVHATEVHFVPDSEEAHQLGETQIPIDGGSGVAKLDLNDDLSGRAVEKGGDVPMVPPEPNRRGEAYSKRERNVDGARATEINLDYMEQGQVRHAVIGSYETFYTVAWETGLTAQRFLKRLRTLDVPGNSETLVWARRLASAETGTLNDPIPGRGPDIDPDLGVTVIRVNTPSFDYIWEAPRSDRSAYTAVIATEIDLGRLGALYQDQEEESKPTPRLHPDLTAAIEDLRGRSARSGID